MEESALYPQDLNYVCDMVRSRSAIVLGPEKAYLVESRLEPLVKSEGLVSLTELVQKMRQAPYGALPKKVVEAMTTNETIFPRPDPISGVAGTTRIHIISAISQGAPIGYNDGPKQSMSPEELHP